MEASLRKPTRLIETRIVCAEVGWVMTIRCVARLFRDHEHLILSHRHVVVVVRISRKAAVMLILVAWVGHGIAKDGIVVRLKGLSVR